MSDGKKDGNDGRAEESITSETIDTLNAIVMEVGEFIKGKLDEKFDEIGLRDMIIAYMKKDGATKKDIKNVSYSTLDQGSMLRQTGKSVNIVPDLLDGVTKKPIKGTMYFVEVRKKIEFDFTEEVFSLEETKVDEAVNADGGNEELGVVRASLQKNINDIRQKLKKEKKKAK